MDYKTFQGDQLVKVFTQSPLPAIKGWNRLEGRPRTDDFDQTLRAEVRDPLWMLTRQWQLGEFLGNDAGSPAFAKVKVATTRLDRYQVKDGEPQAYDETMPLEAQIERERLPLEGQLVPLEGQPAGAQRIPTHLSLSLQIGRHWLRLLDQARAAGRLSRDYTQDFKNAYPIVLPPRDAQSGDIYAHQDVWQMFAATAGRSMDGSVLYRAIRDGSDILEAITIDNPDDVPVIRDLVEQLVRWLRRLYSEPEPNEVSAWAPSYLEYQVACSAPHYDGSGQIVLTADEYHHGHLDWYAFDIRPDVDEIAHPPGDGAPAPDLPNAQTTDFIPTVIEFEGMPMRRWWEFEDRKTNFGAMTVHTTDLAKLLLIEFGLLYANDWFVVPFEVPVGSLARIEGLAVTNVFGERIWIEAADSGQHDDQQPWAMYHVNVRGTNRPADWSIFVPPAVDRLQESQPLAQVHLIRDERANMVWGIESRVPLLSGAVKDGYETATAFVNYLLSLLPTPVPDTPEVPNDAQIRYVLMTTVPENWIPFIPVRMPESPPTNRKIQLQRAAMLRSLPGTTERPQIRPRTAMLRHNGDGPYYLHEEAIPRAGAHVTQTFQRARWHDGKVYVWLGRRKRTGRGEGSNGLRFDQIIPKA